MIRPGLVSVSFRNLSPAQVVALAVEAALEGIEWGGDVHVPHGNVSAAREAVRITDDGGLKVAAYGSYYRAAASESRGLAFEAVLASAKLLGAPTVRVWAGIKGSREADESDRQAVIADLWRISEMAAEEAITVSVEYHSGTLFDTPQSASWVLQSCAHANLKTYWQPRIEIPVEESAGEIAHLLPWLTNLHVYHWCPTSGNRMPLWKGSEAWISYFHEVSTGAPGERYAMLEFFRDDAPSQCVEDARVLKGLLSAGHASSENAKHHGSCRIPAASRAEFAASESVR